MAIRYSGDVEIRLAWSARKRRYVGSVVDPFLRWPPKGQGSLPHRSGRIPPNDPRSYDIAALAFLAEADRWARRQDRHPFQTERRSGGYRIRRVFQAPCPL